jgi:hypothetical protein
VRLTTIATAFAPLPAANPCPVFPLWVDTVPNDTTPGSSAMAWYVTAENRGCAPIIGASSNKTARSKAGSGPSIFSWSKLGTPVLPASNVLANASAEAGKADTSMGSRPSEITGVGRGIAEL